LLANFFFLPSFLPHFFPIALFFFCPVNIFLYISSSLHLHQITIFDTCCSKQNLNMKQLKSKVFSLLCTIIKLEKKFSKNYVVTEHIRL
jgi:hypothetical protein